MTKYLALTRVNLQMALYQLSLVRRTTGRREGRGFQTGLIIIVLVIMAYWGFWSNQMTKSLGDSGVPWLTLVLGMLFVSFMIMGLGLYTFNSLLFESADTDQLFAMPLSKLTVLLGKVSGIVVENWIIGLVFWLPMVIVYGNYAHPAPLFYVFALVTLLIMPGVPLFILALISYLVGLLASGGRWRKILQIVLTLGFMAAIGFGLRYATAQLLATAKIDTNANVQDLLFALLQRTYPPVGYAIHGLIAGSWSAMGLAVLWNVLPFLAIATLIAASYAWIRSRITAVARVTGGHVTYKTTSAARTLFGKELSRLFGSPMYMLNSLIGALLTILFAFLFAISTGKNAEGMRELLAQLGITLTPILLITFLFMLSLANTTAASISLEGKNLWIVQSMPVDAATVLRSKLLVQLTTIPAIVLVSCVISLFTVSVGGTGFVMLLVPCLVFTVVSACLGLIYNLHFHRFDFYNDMQVVKNSASVLLTMGTMAVVVAAATFGYWLLRRFMTVNLWAYWGVWVAILVVAAVVLYRHLMTRGVVMFQELSG